MGQQLLRILRLPEARVNNVAAKTMVNDCDFLGRGNAAHALASHTSCNHALTSNSTAAINNTYPWLKNVRICVRARVYACSPAQMCMGCVCAQARMPGVVR